MMVLNFSKKFPFIAEYRAWRKTKLVLRHAPGENRL
jgi:hypothetical protein